MTTRDPRKISVAEFKRKITDRLDRDLEGLNLFDDMPASLYIPKLRAFVLTIDERDAKTPGGLKGPKRRKP